MIIYHPLMQNSNNFTKIYKTGQDADNIGAKSFMDGIILPKLQDEDRDLLDADKSETEVLQAIN